MQRNLETTRPYRLIDAKLGVEVRWHYFQVAMNAHYAALKLLHTWQKVGTTYQLWNIRSGKLLAEYTRTPTGIQWRKDK